jgi:hypothetical protein
MLIESLSLISAHPALPPTTPLLRRTAAAALHGTGRVLQRLARRLTEVPAQPAIRSSTPLLEFHAEAGAPEGALYIDGRLVAHLAGVRRL